MSSIGPTLPPHLAKRKREGDEDAESSPKRSSSPESIDKRRRVLGPAPPPVPAPHSPITRPSRPSPTTARRSSSAESDIGPAPPPAAKPSRILGPAPPPANLSERPPNPPSSDSDSSDDDFGPAPPPAGGATELYDHEDEPARSAFDTEAKYVEQARKVERDEWMTMPPTQDDLAARMDPTKMRARKFNSGKGSRGGASGPDMGVWTETPEQKLKRLQNEALGISAPANSGSTASSDSRRAKEDEKAARKIKEKIDASRGKSLVEQHREKGTGKEKEDDPSKRGFDYEKDMAGGLKIGHKQRKEMLDKSKGFGDRFSGGSFL